MERRTLIINTLRSFALFAAGVLVVSTAGCGGGGGGGAAPADVVGRIVSVGSGSPISGATVNIGGGSVQTIADGTFVLRNVSSAATQITVSGTGLQTLTSTLGPLTPNAVNDLRDIFVLSTADGGGYTANIKAQVVRADTLAPVPNATVLISGHGTTTDATGNFTIDGLPTGLGNAGTPVGVIKATSQGLEDKEVLIDFPLVASPPVNDMGQIQMAPPVGEIPGGPFNIKGKVFLQGATDLSGTTVTLKNKTTGAPAGSGVTGSEGTFGFWVAAGTYTVTATHAGPPAFQPKSQDVTLTSPDKTVSVTLTLVP
jgi:hypothetical protein